MVVFCCSVCGDSLKKNQVQKHYSRCRMNMVSCMDCSKEFWNDDYQEHIKCISEEEKYSGKDYKPRPGQNKGEVKQDAWLQQVEKAIDNSSPSPRLRHLLERMKEYPNIPRKQTKFLNFIKNSLRISDPKLGISVWDILMSAVPPKEEPKANGKKNDNQNTKKTEEEEEDGKVKEEEEDSEATKIKLSKREKKEERRKGQSKMEKKDSSQKQKQNSDDENVDDDGVEKKQENNRLSKKKGKKRKEEEYYVDNVQQQNGQETKKKKKSHKKQKDDDDDGMPPLEPNPNHHVGEEEEEDEEEEEEDARPPKKKVNKNFNWEQIILTLLATTKEKTMSEKKLRKKVFAEYMDQGCHMDSVSLLKAKFDRKIKKNPQFVRQKDQVTLID